MRVGVFGAGGRMGAEVCRTVAADPSLELVAAIDPFHAGIDLRQATGVDVPGIQIAQTADEMLRAKVDVAVDFTHLDAAVENLDFCAANGIHAVVGTTGFGADHLASFRSAFVKSNCLIASNFAIGAVLMMRFAEMAAPFFDTAEIIEYHHDTKLDSPSGTAMSTANRMAAAREASGNKWALDPTKTEVLPGSRGGVGPSGIHVHGVRMRGVVANQEVMLGTTGQTLTIRHDTTDRTSFMPGVILAVKKIAEFSGVTIGLDPFLSL